MTSKLSERERAIRKAEQRFQRQMKTLEAHYYRRLRIITCQRDALMHAARKLPS